jgi:murein L,D-transpeptidase YcbB/YkuD
LNVFPIRNLNNNNQLLLSLSNNKTTIKKNYTSSSIFLMFASSLILLSLLMFYMPTSYGQTIDSGEIGLEDLQACAEGEVFNADTQMCEPAATEEQVQAPGEEEVTITGEEEQVQAPTDEIHAPVEELIPTDEIHAPVEELMEAPVEELTPLETPLEEKAPAKRLPFNCFIPSEFTLQVGSQGDKVIELQTYLTDLGYGNLLEPEGIDGKFGPHTKNAVMAYQKNSGLTVDGIVGFYTWTYLCNTASFLR